MSWDTRFDGESFILSPFTVYSVLQVVTHGSLLLPMIHGVAPPVDSGVVVVVTKILRLVVVILVKYVTCKRSILSPDCSQLRNQANLPSSCCHANLVHSCKQTGHSARECPEKSTRGGLTGECYNCGEIGHNKADCSKPRVEREFTGTCNACGAEGHVARSCPANPVKCKLCDKQGHKALECNERRLVDWAGVPEFESGEAWIKLIDAAKDKDLDGFRTCLMAYARSVMDDFNLPDVEVALREDGLPVFLIAKQQEIPAKMTVVDMIGNPGRKFVLTIQLSDKPRRKMFAQGWPKHAAENLERLASAGFVQDRGVPLCGTCGKLGHVRKVWALHIRNVALIRTVALQAGAI